MSYWPFDIVISRIANALTAPGPIGSTTPGTGAFSSIDCGAFITGSGALAITPAAGSGVNIVLSTTGDFVVNTNQLFVDTSAARVGIGNAAPTNKLTVGLPGDTSNNYVEIAASGTAERGVLLTRASTTDSSVVQDAAEDLVIRYRESDLSARNLHIQRGSAHTNVATFDQNGNATFAAKVVSSSATSGIGYATGAGGTVTQATSKSTGVTLNKITGQITMNNANLATGTSVTFTLTNSAIAAGDLLLLNHVSGGTTGAYSFSPRSAAGSATITVRNITAGDLAEAVVIGFAVVKAVTA